MGSKYFHGGESRVYPLSEQVSQQFGEPCVIKIYTQGAIIEEHEPVPLESLAEHESKIARGLRQNGLKVPNMHKTVLFDSPPEGHTHYVDGRKVPGLVMGKFKELRKFEDLKKSERGNALGSFVDGVITAMREGYNPFFDTFHNRNVSYDLEGNATFYDFCQWEQGEPLGIKEIKRFFNMRETLPEGVWLADGYLESII